MRWVHRNRTIHPWSHCRLCGTAWGGYKSGQCPPTTCPVCGTRTCMGYGLGNGRCPVCYFGLLPGWSGSNKRCGYKGCDKPAIAIDPRNRNRPVCEDHWRRLGGDEIAKEALARRGADWIEVED